MRTISMLLIAVSILMFSGCGDSNADQPLVIYTYDSFVSEWGPGPVVFKAFTEATGIEVDVIAGSDANEIITKALAEKDSPAASVLLGLDNTLLELAAEKQLLEPYSPSNISNAADHAQFNNNLMTAFDYGYFAIVYDSQQLDSIPTSLEDLTKPEYKDKLILIDPRTSSPGLGFLTWTMAVYGDDYLDYWNRLKPSILTITEGWSQAYGAFTNEEAPMVLSYTTSPVYHLAFEETDRYQAAVFSDGHVIQIEGAALVKNAPAEEAAKKFLDFILENDFQNALPLTNIMYPASTKVQLPESFSIAPSITNIIRPEELFTAEEIEDAQDRWKRTMAN